MRNEHTFTFNSKIISVAAEKEAQYHRQRQSYWNAEYFACANRVTETAKIVVREYAVTGGTRVDVSVDYGDELAYRRMQEAFSKAQSHRQTAERYESDALIYSTQDRSYELSADDVNYFRLGNQPRED